MGCEVNAKCSDRCLCSLWVEARMMRLIRPWQLQRVNARIVKVECGFWIIGISNDELGLPLVQKAVLALLLLTEPRDLEEANSIIRELDPSLELNQAGLHELIGQLSEAAPCQHCSILES